jgi:hypothetical protein
MKSVPSLAAASLAAALVSLGLAGCASTGIDAQWKDPQLTGSPLSSGRVLVVCEAAEVVLSRICVDRLSADLQARGATVVTAPDDNAPVAGQSRDDSRYLERARQLGASVVWAASVNPTSAADTRSGSGVSIGLGGFGFGRGSGVGVGMSMPVGGGAPPPQYAADARVTNAANGRLLWTARAGSPPSGDGRSQVENLLQRLVNAAGEAQLF